MFTKTTWRRTVTVALVGMTASVVAFTGGIWIVQSVTDPTGANAAPAAAAANEPQTQDEGQDFSEDDIKWLGIELARSNFPENSNGQTYGSMSDAATLEEMPDLVAVVGDNGYEGFVEKKHLVEPEPSNPTEALEIERRMRANLPAPVPVYAVDGKTQLDVFTPFVAGR